MLFSCSEVTDESRAILNRTGAPIYFQGSKELPDELSSCWLSSNGYSKEELISFLDSGAERIVFDTEINEFPIIPENRCVFSVNVLLDHLEKSKMAINQKPEHSALLLKILDFSLQSLPLLQMLISELKSRLIIIDLCSTLDLFLIQKIGDLKVQLLIPLSSISMTPKSTTLLDLGEILAVGLKSDRPDGLFSTVVANEHGTALGLVYSTKESISASIYSGRGIYHSRNRGLWLKGETSGIFILTKGSFQDLHRIQIDCDSDALLFIVYQHGAGFCHLETASCWGNLRGIGALESVLHQRRRSSPAGSYTNRLFNDPELLKSSKFK